MADYDWSKVKNSWADFSNNPTQGVRTGKATYEPLGDGKIKYSNPKMDQVINALSGAHPGLGDRTLSGVYDTSGWTGSQIYNNGITGPTWRGAIEPSVGTPAMNYNLAGGGTVPNPDYTPYTPGTWGNNNQQATPTPAPSSQNISQTSISPTDMTSRGETPGGSWTPSQFRVDFNGNTFTLGTTADGKYQFYGPNGSPSGVYATPDGRMIWGQTGETLGTWDQNSGMINWSAGGASNVYDVNNQTPPITTTTPSGTTHTSNTPTGNPTTGNNQPTTYSPPYGLVNAQPEDIAKAGLGYAAYVAGQSANREHTFPSWWGSEAVAPAQYDFPSYVANNPLQQVNIPGDYHGLMGGDYNRLEQSLRQPGETAAQNAYNQGNRRLNDVMNARGMYGSSVMGQQANEGLNREFQNAMATNAANAAAQRYNMQQQDLQYGAGYGLQKADLTRQQNLDTWKSGLQDAIRQQGYGNQALAWKQSQDEAQRNFANSMLQGQYAHEQAKQTWQDAIDEMMINRGLALAGKGAPLSAADQRYNLAQQQANANETAGFWNTALNPQTWQTVGQLGSWGQNAWDWITGGNDS